MKDIGIECPSAQQLCKRVAALKDSYKYKNAHERVKDDNGKDSDYNSFQILLEEKNTVIVQKDVIIAEKEEQLRKCKEELQQIGTRMKSVARKGEKSTISRKIGKGETIGMN